MAYIFKIAYKKGKKLLLKIDTQDKSKTSVKWMPTTEAVFNYVKSNFEEDDEIGIEYTKKGPTYHVVRANKEGKNKELGEEAVAPEAEVEPKVENETKTTTKEKGKFCLECGKKLTNEKYDTCWSCHEKSPSKGKYSQRSPEVQASIKMQVAYKVAAEAILVFTGVIADLDTLKTQLDDLAEHIVKKF